ncbi:hypothetical protein DTW92_15685 [Paracoccus pantotrophus]|nr:hypothetical protein DTW92_15685 [Paracoccus pantotrophus]WGR66157.1 hypothetical protein E3U24_12605 [Paracoccus pantotrophus]
MANGAMAHALDYDDQTPWGQHSALTLLPSVLAVAERKGRRCDEPASRESVTL